MAELIRNEKEAIECIKNNIPTSGYQMLRQSCEMAISALEKQIPTEPTYEGDGYAPDGSFVWDEWLCPNCNSRFELEYDEYNFCPNCGQRIDWSGKDEID